MPKTDKLNSKTGSLENYLGIKTLPQKEKQAIIKHLEKLIQATVMNAILKNLKPQDCQVFIKKLRQTGNRQSDWLTFARKKVRRLDSVVNQKVKDVLQTVKLGV